MICLFCSSINIFYQNSFTIYQTKLNDINHRVISYMECRYFRSKPSLMSWVVIPIFNVTCFLRILCHFRPLSNYEKQHFSSKLRLIKKQNFTFKSRIYVSYFTNISYSPIKWKVIFVAVFSHLLTFTLKFTAI